MDDKELDRHLHQIKGHHASSSTVPKDLVIPYAPLPLEILRADGKCHVTMFTAGISTILSAFIQHENTLDPSNHLTEEEWLDRYTKFIKDHGKKPKKASKR